MWDERYAGDDYLFGTAPNAFLRAQAHRLRPGLNALAIADGEGRNGVRLAEQGLDVTAMDASAVGLAKARRLAETRGVTLRLEKAEIAAWPWQEAAFDVVAAIFVQVVPPAERAAMFAGIRTTLRPGGLLLLQGYRPEQVGYGTGGPPQAEHMYTRAMLEQAFEGFDLVHLSEHDSDIREGDGHGGISALIDLVAVRPDRTKRG